MRALLLLVVSLALAGCGDTGTCRDAQKRLGYRLCVEHVASNAGWSSIAGKVSQVDQIASARYLVPARAGARLPTVFEDDAAPSKNHYEFLTEGFPDRFPALTLEQFDAMTTDPAQREFFAGTITEYVTPSGDHVFGYLIWDKQDAAGSVTCDQAKQVHAALEQAFAPRPLMMVAATHFQSDMLASCGLPVFDAAANVSYEAYTPGVAYGNLRLYTLAQFQQATTNAEFGWQDILVVDEAPIDIETIISGAITGTRQGELSHLNVRSAGRGTPNCYSRDAFTRLAPYAGKLVRIECGATELTVQDATPADAQAWWNHIRPAPVTVPAPDYNFTDLLEIHAVPTSTPEERALTLRRFGGKTLGVAELYQRIPTQITQPAFAIPFAHYQNFMHANGLDAVLAQDLADPNFQSDSAYRRQKLLDLQGAILAAPTCDPALLDAMGKQIVATMGSPNVMVHVRSSSNTEDLLAFYSSGLYLATSACLADDQDADPYGPSLCDPDQPKERPLCRALKYVYASLWSPKAYDERAWYGIDQTQVAMALTVNTQNKGELANIVAFTGNPVGPDRNQYSIDAQVGSYDAVDSQPGVWPEKDLLTLSDGAVTAIERPRASSQVQPGGVVLTDDQLRTLGAAYWNIAQVVPVDDVAPPGKRILLNSEWKLRANGTFLIYEVRTFMDSQ